jgi:hypothetical protein
MSIIKKMGRFSSFAGGLAATIASLLLLPSCPSPVGNQDIKSAQEICLETVWTIPFRSPGQGINALFIGNRAYFLYVPDWQMCIIDLDSGTVIRTIQLSSFGSPPALCNDHIFIPTYISEEEPKLSMFDLEGNLLGEMVLPRAQEVGCSSLRSVGTCLYWQSFSDIEGDDAKALYRLDARTIILDGSGAFTASIRELCPCSKGFENFTSPSDYEGMIYISAVPVEPDHTIDYYTRLFIFDEATGVLISENDLDSQAGPYPEALLRLLFERRGVDPHTIKYLADRTIPRSSAPGSFILGCLPE